MPKRTICIQNPAKLSVKNDSLIIFREGNEAAVPLEDIWVVILESHSAVITSAALASLASSGIGLMTCGTDHMPNGLALPIGAHSRHAAIVEHQLAMPRPLKKNLWRRIVCQKIQNQAFVLEQLGKDSRPVKACAENVLSDDASNREAVAASAYFKKLIDEGTRREGPYTAPLDYGYGVLRAAIGRAAVSSGWLVSRGIHHSSDLNAFNLVDDLIEPYRPVVDLLVCEHGLQGELNPAKKLELASVLEYLVALPLGEVSLQAAIEIMSDSLRSAILEQDASLLQLPVLLPLKRGYFE